MGISRREFVKLSGIMTGLLSLCRKVPLSFAESLNEPVFSFLQITDFHLGSYGDYENGMTYLTNRILNQEDFTIPDLILATGDLADEGTDEQYVVFNKYMGRLDIPIYAIPGNHHDGGYKELTSAYRNHIGSDKTNYDFTHKGIHFIMLARYNTHVDWEWLENTVSNSTMPIIMADHYPLRPVRTEGRAVDYVMKGEEFTQIIQKHSDKIVALLTGHSHVNSLIIGDDIYHIGTQAIATLPNSYRHFTVYKDKIEVKTHFLQKEAGKYFWWGGYQWEFSDALHPTTYLYNFGNENERNFTMPVALNGESDILAPSPPQNPRIEIG